MAILDFRPKADIWTGLAIGVGLLVAPVVIPIVAAAARPILKSAIKSGFMLYEKGCELVAEAVEAAEDLVEEAKCEVRSEIADLHE